MKSLCGAVFTVFWALFFTAVDDSGSIGKTIITHEIVFQIHADSVGIQISKMGEGPTGFSILDNETFVLGYEKKLMFFSRAGSLQKEIICPGSIGHFDIKKNGNGLVAIGNNFYAIQDFKVNRRPMDVGFSLQGNTAGMLRMDFLNDSLVRFISLSPDFVVTAKVDSLESAKSTEPGMTESAIINKITEYVGTYRDRLVFFFPFETKQTSHPFYELVAFKVEKEAVDAKRIRILGDDIGNFMLLSYPCRYYGDDFFYVMTRKDDLIIISKIFLTGLRP